MRNARKARPGVHWTPRRTRVTKPCVALREDVRDVQSSHFLFTSKPHPDTDCIRPTPNTIIASMPPVIPAQAIVFQSRFDVSAVPAPESIGFNFQFPGVDQRPCYFPGRSRCIFLVADEITSFAENDFFSLATIVRWMAVFYSDTGHLACLNWMSPWLPLLGRLFHPTFDLLIVFPWCRNGWQCVSSALDRCHDRTLNSRLRNHSSEKSLSRSISIESCLLVK